MQKPQMMRARNPKGAMRNINREKTPKVNIYERNGQGIQEGEQENRRNVQQKNNKV
jgi:hypothetical protein